MHALNRRGFSLIELLIALALGGLVSMAVLQSVISTQRASQAGMQKMDLHQNLRAGAAYLGSVLREVDAGDDDITVATATQLRFRSMRWTGVLCADPATVSGNSIMFTIRADMVYGMRAPNATEDSLMVFADGDPFTRTDDTWLAGAVTAVGTSTCTDASAATTVTAKITAASGGRNAARDLVTSGAPLRGFQTEEISLLQSNSRWWMGQRTANRSGTWSTAQPLVGPLAASGLALTYYDSTGAVTADSSLIASIQIILRGESMALVRQGIRTAQYARDSLITRVALRNNPRY